MEVRLMKDLTMNEMMEVNGGKDSVEWDSNSGGGFYYTWKKDSKGNIDIEVPTPIGTLKIHDDASNNVTYNKHKNSKGVYTE
tara:strand:- start:68 stop:313 length:246 start_codon:yes stop_codon:yes gene_type:complete